MDENTACAGPGSDSKKNEVEMESTIPSTKCTCGFQFGVFPLSSQDSQSSSLAVELNNMSINFHGPAGNNERISAKEKINEIKKKVAEYYYDPKCKVIAIPNHFVTPKKPTVLGKEGKQQQDDQILDKYLEECLHHELVNEARKLKMESFIFQGFQAADCIHQLYKKGKDTRGKDKYAEFNKYEKRVKEILDIEDVEEEKLKSCIDEHLRWRKNPLQFQGPDNWLFKQVYKSQVDSKRFKINSKQEKHAGDNSQNRITEHSNTDQCSSSSKSKGKGMNNQTCQTGNIKEYHNRIENTFLFKIPDDRLRNFYKYQFYNFSLQENKTEWDTIMIIPEYSAIINIEVKRGCNDSSGKLKLLKDASDQTKQHFSFIQKLFGGMLSKEWVFVRAACVPNLEIAEDSVMPCVNCQQFILQEKDIKHEVPWLKQLFDNHLVTSDNYDETVYENLVAELIYHISIKESSKFNQLISETLTVSRETEKALTGKTDGISGESSIPKNMLTDEQLELIGNAERISRESSIPKNMLTDEQLELTGNAEGISGEGTFPKNMLADEQLELTGNAEGLSGEGTFPKNMLSDKQLKSPEKIVELSEESNVPLYMLTNEQLQAVHSQAKFLIIVGDYGTGKTYVLKERAKKCAKANIKNQLFYIDLTTLTIPKYSTVGFKTAESSVMEIIATKDFESYPNIKVFTTKYLGISGERTEQTDIINALNSFLRNNHCDHLFIDEMIIGEYDLPDSIETICINLKVAYDDISRGLRENFKTKKETKWLETMKMNNNAVFVNLNKNMRNSQQIIHLAKALEKDSTQQVSCSPDTNVMGNHNFYYRNIYDIEASLLAVAAVNKYFIHKPQESVVIIADNDVYRSHIDKIFQLLHKHFSSTTSVVRDFREYIKKPEGLLVTSIEKFQGAQARNIIIITQNNLKTGYIRNVALRTMSFAIIILGKHNNNVNGLGAIEDKNLQEFIYPEEKAPECHHYHNKDKHDISALTMAILDKYKLFDQDESIVIITYSRISKDIIREANSKEFFSLTYQEKRKQIDEKIKLENKELYEDVKRNISRNFADISCSYYNKTRELLKDLVNKPRHINYVNIVETQNDHLPLFEDLTELKNIIVFADEHIDHKREFAAWEDIYSLKYSDGETSIDVVNSKWKRNDYDGFCRNVIMLYQPKFAIVVHDDNFESFNQPEGALNLIEDDNLHEYIPVTNTELSNQ